MNIVDYVLGRAGSCSIGEHATHSRTDGAGLGRDASYVAHLAQLGDRVGKPILVEVDLDLQSLIRLFGVLLAGGIAVPISSKIAEHKLSRALEVTGADCALVRPDRRSSFQRLLEGHRHIQTVPAAGPATSAHRKKPKPGAGTTGGGDPAVILLTSGTTGMPKGVTLTHTNLVANLEAVQQVIPLTREDRVALTLPLQYSFGLSTTLLTLASGASGVFLPPLQFVDEFVAALGDAGTTVFAGVPGHFEAMLRHERFRESSLPTLRMALQAGGPMPERLTRALVGAFPGCAVHLMYGQTEATARLTALAPEKVLTKPRSVGAPLTGVSIQVLDDDLCPVPVDTEGEIYASGPNVMSGYWNDPRGTACVLTSQGLRTGDVGRIDAEGDLRITGRRSEFAKIRGERLSAREVEDIVCETPGVQGAVVQVGRLPADVDDRLRALMVVEHQGPPEILDLVRRRILAALGPAVVPELVVVEQLPVTENGKKIRHYEPETDSANSRTLAVR